MVMFILYYLYSNIRYLCTDWRTFYTDRGAAAALGALSNVYCYLGVTEQHLNMVIVNSVNVSKIENRLSLPLSSITKAEVKGGLLPGRKVVMLHFGKEKMKISLMNNAIGSDIQRQIEMLRCSARLFPNSDNRADYINAL